MKLLEKIADALIFTNVFLALCVTSLVFETSIILTGSLGSFKYPLFLFSSTLFLYCFHRIYKYESRDPKEILAKRHTWLRDNLPLFVLIMIVSGVVVMLCLFYFIEFEIILYLLPVAFISFGYTIPFIPWKGKRLRLRDITGIKIFLITLVLGLTTVLLPVLAYGDIQDWKRADVLFVFLRRMLFIFAITIPFDIRDIEYDRSKGTQTIPVVWGIRNSKVVALCSLIVFVLLGLIQHLFFDPIRVWYMLALIISLIPAVWGIMHARTDRSDYFFSLFMEGTMLFQCLLVIAADTLV